MKITIISIIAIIIFVFVVNISNKNKDTREVKVTRGEKIDDSGKEININNVSVVDNKQIIEIIADGGYTPRKSVAKANIPTVIRFITKNTFDCSSAIRIQSLNISKNLPSTGVTDITIPAQDISVLKGSCGMGMYPFQIEFN